ncbi:Serine protease inhibitor (serpin) [Nesidiocoris tenuis]|uniref:Serine protease inhibitor (Serpin) n=1 Tax=Nesidiocoris tenuis TaxID=355587 RepID=A0ABN7ARW3_9HEMI|nr:Serine protease inhibitor (serpin) [Nesidiocoris tenuis]
MVPWLHGLLCLVSSLPLVIGEGLEADKQFQSFTKFDLQLAQLIAGREKSNIALSPISVKLVLAMLYEGASGNTSKELQNVLEIKDSRSLSTSRLSQILMSLQGSNKGYDIAVGTKLFLDEKAVPKQKFEQRIKDLYNGTIERIDFLNTTDAVSRINAWANTVTRGHIHHLLSEIDTSENTVLLLVNALYFKGLWENQFPLNQTKDDTFYVDGVTPLKVPFMNAVHNLEYIENLNANFSAVRLPYQGGKFAMYIVLPFEKTGLQSVVQRLTPEIVRQSVAEMQTVSVQLKLPKFKFEYSASLAPALKALGLNEMFSPDADLTEIAETPKDLVVSNVIQKTAIEVNEQGSTASVATSVDITSKFGDHIVDFEATHPFIFYIEDETTDTVVFIAKVVDPSGSGKPIVSASGAQMPPVQPTAAPPATIPGNNALSQTDGARKNGSANGSKLDLDTFSHLDIELLKELRRNGPQNWVVSPASIKTALSLVYEGSDGSTAAELADALRLPEDRTAGSNTLQLLQSNLHQATPSKSIVRSANRVLLKKGLTVDESYRKTIETVYKGDVVTADFSNPSGVVQEVNKWIRDNTQGFIPELLSEGSLNGNSSFIIVNAMYFTSAWQTPFDGTSTDKSCFHTEKNDCVKVDMMRTKGPFRTGHLSYLKSQVVEIPYVDNRYSLVILLPDKTRSLSQVARDIHFYNLHAVLETLPYLETMLTIPKFTIEYYTSLKETLNNLDVSTMFTDKADLSKMLKNPANTLVTEIIHKAKIEVNEAGTTAAAGSAIYGQTLSHTSSIAFRADRPFFFFIRDSLTGFLFEGQFASPDDTTASPATGLSLKIDKMPAQRPQGGPISEPYPSRPITSIVKPILNKLDHRQPHPSRITMDDSEIPSFKHRVP